MKLDWIGVVVLALVLATMATLAVLVPDQKATLIAAIVGVAGTAMASLRGKLVEPPQPPPGSQP